MILGLTLSPLLPLTISCFWFNILRSDVFRALARLNPQKSYGSDGAPPIVLKNCASELPPCLAKLLHLCLSTLTFPS